MVSLRSEGEREGGERQPGERRSYDVLLLDGEHKQSLAAARHLGRAGLRIAIGESLIKYRERPPLPAFRSRYCAHAVVLPNYSTDPQGYVAEVIAFLRENPTTVVLPTGDGSCVTLLPHRKEIAALGTVLALPPDAAMEIALDKDKTLSRARDLGIHCPKSIPIQDLEELSAAAAEFGFPFVLRPTTSWTGKTTTRVVPVEVINKDEAAEVAVRLFASGAGVLAQQWIPGRREGVTLFIANSEVMASCGHVEHRTTPLLGGVSVLRESIAIPQDIYYPAVQLAKAIGVEGVCTVEFRRDAEGRPLLMEVNPRLVGTLDNSIRSGVAFPWLIWQWATDQPIDRIDSFRFGVRTRWLHGELRWLRENILLAGRPDSISRLRSILIFFAEFVRTRHYDYFDFRDLGPVIAEMRYTIAAVRKSLHE